MVTSPNAVVALYCRITIDKSGRREGVEAQERYGRAHAAQQWPGVPIEVFADNHVTAADPDVVRPEFERLRRWVRDGLVSHIWCIEQFRFVRQELEWFKVAVELEEAGILEIHTRREGVIRVDDDVAGIKAVLGAGEVRRIKKRINDKNRDAAYLGLPPGGVAFGYRHARPVGKPRTYEIIPEQGEALRWAADMILNLGWSTERVASELRERGMNGPRRRKVIDEDTGEPVIDLATGEPVTRPTNLTAPVIRSALMSPASAGLRVYRGEIIGKGNWEPILTEETRQRLCAHFGAPRTVNTVDGQTYPVVPMDRTGRTRRKYLLTGGMATCGVCNARLVASLKQKKGKDSIPYYSCHPKAGGKACVGIDGAGLEDYVVKKLFEELAKPGRVEAFLQDDHADRRKELTDELGAIEVRRTELASMWGERQITTDEWKAMRSGLDAAESKARSELAITPPPPDGFDSAALEDPRTYFGMELLERRAFLDMFIETVTVKRATPPYGRWEDERVVIKFR
jgi:site-specific DNA recombinase